MIRLLYHLFSPLGWEKLRVWGMGVVRELWQLDANKITLWNNDDAFLRHWQGKKIQLGEKTGCTNLQLKYNQVIIYSSLEIVL